jgi:molecular chaperone GrpE
MATLLKDNEQYLLPPADLAKEIERMQESLRDERDLRLRNSADFKNYRRRIERDGNRIAEEGKRDIIFSLLAIIDDMDKTLQCVDDVEQNLLKGVRNIRKKLQTQLETLGVFPFDSVGKLFDHDLHEAISMEEHEDIEQGTIIDELRRGYIWKNELLRPAQVRVAG